MGFAWSILTSITAMRSDLRAMELGGWRFSSPRGSAVPGWEETLVGKSGHMKSHSPSPHPPPPNSPPPSPAPGPPPCSPAFVPCISFSVFIPDRFSQDLPHLILPTTPAGRCWYFPFLGWRWGHRFFTSCSPVSAFRIFLTAGPLCPTPPFPRTCSCLACFVYLCLPKGRFCPSLTCQIGRSFLPLPGRLLPRKLSLQPVFNPASLPAALTT